MELTVRTCRDPIVPARYQKTGFLTTSSRQFRLMAAIQSMEHLDRASNSIQKRKFAASLATHLNTVDGQSAILVLDFFRTHNAVARLLQLLREALDEYDEGASTHSDWSEADTVLAASLLSALASLSFIGGVSELQMAGGVLQLLKLMRFPGDDGTVRSYAAACLQNASSFVELFDLALVDEEEEAELLGLIKDADTTIATPARHIFENLHQLRRHQNGRLDVDELTTRLERAKADGPRLLTANLDSRWWEHTASLEKIMPPDAIETVDLVVELRCGEAGFGVRLAPALVTKTAPTSTASELAPAPTPAPMPAPGSTPPPDSAPSTPPPSQGGSNYEEGYGGIVDTENETAEGAPPAKPDFASGNDEERRQLPAMAPASEPATAPSTAYTVASSGVLVEPPGRGVLVTRVAADGPNADALKVGDEIVVISGQPITGPDAHSEALAILKTFIASGYGPENVLVVTVRRLCNRTAEREAAEQAEVERLAEKARLFPFKDVHAQLTELTHQTLKVVDPMEAARFALLVEGTPMPPMAEEVTADTSGRASSANGSEALSLPFQRAPKAQRQHDRLMLGAAGAAQQNGISLSVQAAQRKVDDAWLRAMRVKVRVSFSGSTIELTGSQVMGLHSHAFKATSHSVAVKDKSGERIVLSLPALTILKERIEMRCLHAAEGDLKRIQEEERAERAREDNNEGSRDRDKDETTITFLDAEKLRGLSKEGLKKEGMTRLQPLHVLRASHPHWLVERRLSLKDACTGAHTRSILAVSHRWESRLDPDPEGVQFGALLEHLENHPEIQLVWYDYCCTPLYHPPDRGMPPASMPRLLGRPPPTPSASVNAGSPGTATAPSEIACSDSSRASSRASSCNSAASSRASNRRTGKDGGAAATAAAAEEGDEEPSEELDTEVAEHLELSRMLQHAALPFLCCRCLLLVDSGFNARFWTGLEAWLSMQNVTTDGLVPDLTRSRCDIRLLRDEPAFMKDLVVEMWRVHDCTHACEELRRTNGVTFAADMPKQIARLQALQERLETLAR